MNRVYTAAVIGVGRIGMLLEADPKRLKPATHFGMWHSHPQSRLAAVCDSDPAKLERAKALLPGVATYTDPDVMLREIRPDVISIATWRDSHYDMMKLALRHRIAAVVLEKPIAETLAQGREIVAQARDQGMHLLVNHRRRFDPELHRLASELQGGIVGELLQVSSYYVYGLLTTATHLIDTLRMLLKGTAGDICWVAGYPNTAKTFHPPDDPDVDGILGFESGLKVTVQSLDMKSYDAFDFHFYGRAGKLLFHSIGRRIDIFGVSPSPEHHDFTELDTKPRERRGGTPRDLFRLMADNAIACLESRAASLSTGEDSLRALEILLAMRASAADGGRRIEV